MTTQTKIQIRLCPANPPAEMLTALERKQLKYTDPRFLYHWVWLGDAYFCGVFGDGPNGAYEWFIWKERNAGNATLQTSDVGFGSTEAALRAVLNEVA